MLADSHVVYISGAKGFIGRELVGHIPGCIPISYRDRPYNKFGSHKKSTFIHLCSSTNASVPKTHLSKAVKFDVLNSITVCENFLSKNPDGRIIYFSTAGDMYSGHVDEDSKPIPKSIYSCNKLYVENYLRLHCGNCFIFSLGNVWGRPSYLSKKNGLLDRIIHSPNDSTIDITCSPETIISTIHIADVASLTLKALTSPIKEGKWLIGSPSMSIKDIISLFPNQSFRFHSFSPEVHKIFINQSAAMLDFNWSPSYSPYKSYSPTDIYNPKRQTPNVCA